MGTHAKFFESVTDLPGSRLLSTYQMQGIILTALHVLSHLIPSMPLWWLLCHFTDEELEAQL